MFKYVERRKFTETTIESASYTYTVRVHCIYNTKKLKNLFDFEYLKIWRSEEEEQWRSSLGFTCSSDLHDF
jgi:hypothetical protein